MSTSDVPNNPKKRLIVCCDGTWMNSDNGYDKPSLWESLFNGRGKLQTPTNVTRISRSFRRVCSDSTLQIIAYQNGVGSGSTMADKITGGAFGNGVADNIREAYAFICANYNDGDDIILVGFSRGAFTARSVAGMISDLGLLTRQGMEYFYPIFKDMENWRTPGYKDPFPDMPFPNKPKMPKNADEAYQPEEAYRALLVEKGFTRLQQKSGDLIKVKAIGVWDTVGSLGIPNISWIPDWLKTNWLSRKLNLNPYEEFRFYDTNLSNRIEHAFQALALDEHRSNFAPTVWERTPAEEKTELRQVWFPGNHGNIGGGWQDSGIANMSLAWMMDQLASVGVEFDEATITRIFTQLENYYHSTNTSADRAADVESSVQPEVKPKKGVFWAASPIYEGNHPIRPWGLGALMSAMTFAYWAAGGNYLRTPGMYRKLDPIKGTPVKPRTYLQDTNERIHSSVRVRLAAGGLGLQDEKLWDAPALKGKWQLTKSTKKFADPILRSTKTWEHVPERQQSASNGTSGTKSASREATLVEICAEQQRPLSEAESGDRWIWQYCGPEKDAPREEQKILVEEPLGPFERQLLRLAGGKPNIYEYAEAITPTFK